MKLQTKNEIESELLDLNIRIKSLKDFINCDLFEEINETQQELQYMQYESMLDYQACLIARIKNL